MLQLKFLSVGVGESIEQKTNTALKDLQQHGNEVVDVKFTKTMDSYSVFILYRCDTEFTE